MTAMRGLAVLIALCAGLLFLVARDEPHDQRAREPVSLPDGPIIASVRSGEFNGPPYHGVAIQIHNSDDAGRRYANLMDEIAELGADTVMISINGFQQRVNSMLIESDPAVTPPDGVLLDLFARARGLGLRVIVMPKILLSDPEDGAWRGQIAPPSWDGWFDQYRGFLRQFAELAERGDAAVFIVGSELVSSEKFTDQWVRTINEVRRLYRGRIAYSANWDHYSGIRFWDKVDLVGMTTYFKLADKPGPSLADLLASWDRIRKDILEFQAAAGRPLLFTEAGWCSQEGCSVEAWNYYRTERSTPAALEEQRRNFEAFVVTWSGEPSVSGIIWWEWSEGPGGPADFGYTPKNKPAETVLRDLFREKAGGPVVGSSERWEGAAGRRAGEKTEQNSD